RRHEQEQQKRELARMQKEGEVKLAALVRQALDRTGGRPTPADSAAANELVRRFRVDASRANAIVVELQARWAKERKPPPRLSDVVKVTVAPGLEIRFTWLP